MLGFLMNTEDATYGELFLSGGSVLLRGMITVFAVLGIIWFFMTLVRLILNRPTDGQGAKAEQVPFSRDSATVGVVPSTAGATDESELIAVIAAAIAMAEEETGLTGFRVVSFHRVNK